MMTLLALDIGGANLKAADGLGFAITRPFPLWRQPADLPAALAAIIAQAPATECIAVTMTGELADCFESKAQGVASILAAVSQAAAGRQVIVYHVDGSLAPLETARQQPQLVAASNWHVLARFAARYCPTSSGLLVDIGSTTTDLIPILGGRPAAKGACDTDRLASGELVYTGVTRSPICAVVDALPWRGQQVPVAQELFATTHDAYLILRHLEEAPNDHQTADGRPATAR